MESPACQLCQKKGSLENILSSCPKGLGDRRFRWRHDHVLLSSAGSICTGIDNSRRQNPTTHAITFVWAGPEAPTSAKDPGWAAGNSSGLAAAGWSGEAAEVLRHHCSPDTSSHQSWSWGPVWPKQRMVNGLYLYRAFLVLMTTYQYSFTITYSHTHSYSASIQCIYAHLVHKAVVLLEPTVPWEDRMEEVQERKRAKYANLVAECRRNGWKAHCEPVEVGCRGFASQSLHQGLIIPGWIERLGEGIWC